MRLTATIPESPAQLRALLLLIFDGRPFLRFVGVNVAAASLDVVWHESAAADGYHSTFLPLRPDSLPEAQILVEHLLSQMSLGLPPSENAAEELFGMLDRDAATEAERADYDGVTPADALAESEEPRRAAARR
jgi:hypothetical protein